MSNIFTSDAVRSLYAPSAVLLAATLSAVITWAKELNASAKRMRHLEQETKRLEFWQKYRCAFEAGDPNGEHAKHLAATEIQKSASSVQAAFGARRNRGLEAYNALSKRRVAGWQWRLMLFFPSSRLFITEQFFGWLALIFLVIFPPLKHHQGRANVPFTMTEYGTYGAGVLAGLSFWLVERNRFRIEALKVAGLGRDRA